MSIIFLDSRASNVSLKYEEAIGMLYILNFSASDIEYEVLNNAKFNIKYCFDLLDECSQLMKSFWEEPKELELSLVLNIYSKIVEVNTLLNNCVNGLKLSESEVSKHTSYFTKALYTADVLVCDLRNIYEDILHNPPAKKAA